MNSLIKNARLTIVFIVKIRDKILNNLASSQPQPQVEILQDLDNYFIVRFAKCFVYFLGYLV
jgi:hypothetical protein